ncbi:MAG: hypothetical protein FJZ01_00850 [Candidatus Sericytochromatia bacterium]|nr:hypothetical protein [Candidatus Tanganyikabacteria bacterium]
MSLFRRIFIAAVATAALSACGAEAPFGPGAPGQGPGTRPPASLPTVGGQQAAAVSFGPEGPKTPSLYRAADGTWGVAYGSEKLGNKHIYFATSRDGASWTPAAAVQPGALSDIDPALFADSRGFHVIFASNREVPTWALYVCDQTGTGWSAPERLNVPGAMVSEPAVTATPHGWALTYRSSDGLVVAESADGHNWYEARVAATHLGDPAIASANGRLHVVAHRSAQLYEVSRGPSGAWSAPKSLGLSGQAINPALAVDRNGRIALAFGWRRGGPDDPLQLALATRGDAWSAPEALTSGGDDNVNPTLQFLPDGGRALAWGIYPAAGARGIVFASLAAPQGSTSGFAYFPGGAR